MVLDRHDRPLGGLLSEVAGVIQTTPKGQDLINEILMVNDDPDTGNLHVRGKITHPDNPRSVFHSKGRKHTKKIKHPVLDDDATAKEVAEALLDELSTKNKTIKLDVVPDPEPEYVRETVNVLVWNTHGDKVANGQYAIHRIAWGLTKTSATMTMDLGRIDRADNVEDIDN
jgi:hypothetical protein